MKPTKMDIVIDDAVAEAEQRGVAQEGDRVLLSLETTRLLHMAYDGGRPSDAARTIARWYLANPDDFRARSVLP